MVKNHTCKTTVFTTECTKSVTASNETELVKLNNFIPSLLVNLVEDNKFSKSNNLLNNDNTVNRVYILWK